jgi:DNA-binding beta-propeller fold protein YncE
VSNNVVVDVLACSANIPDSAVNIARQTPLKCPLKSDRAEFTGLNQPRGIAVDAAGTVYVADANNNRVLKLAAR